MSVLEQEGEPGGKLISVCVWGGGGTILVCVPLLPSKKDGSKNIWGAHALAVIMVSFSQTICLMGRP